jgi:hypothetical protein
MRRLVFFLAVGWLGCARPMVHSDTPTPASSAGANSEDAMSGGGGGGPEHDPEVVRTGKSFKVGYSEATSRFRKGAPCGGGSSPEAVLGPPDQRNQMQQGKDTVVTYGFRFREGTLLIRCRGDHVEVQRTLK